MKISNINLRISCIFPTEVNQKNNQLPYPMDEIYRLACEKINQGEWSFDNFKKFRASFGNKFLENLKNYGQLTIALLSFSEERMEKELRKLDELYECHIFDEKEYVWSEEEKGIVLKTSKREITKKDIVTVSSAVYGSMQHYCNDFIMKKIALCEENGEDPLTVREILYDEIKCPDSEVLKELEEQFEKKFAYLKEEIAFSTFYEFVKRKICTYMMERLRKEIARYKQQPDKNMDNYMFDLILENRERTRSKGGKAFGAWYD